jgi:hypothetical protein
MKNRFVFFAICLLLIFSCAGEKQESLNCTNIHQMSEICIMNSWDVRAQTDYILYAKLPEKSDFFALNYFDNVRGDQMYYDYLSGTHERFFYPELELVEYSIHEIVNDGFRYLYSIYEFNQQGEKVKYISITFNLYDVFYDIAIRINANNSAVIEDQFRKLVVPSLKLNGKKVFDLTRHPDKITEIHAEPLDSLLRKQ